MQSTSLYEDIRMQLAPRTGVEPVTLRFEV